MNLRHTPALGLALIAIATTVHAQSTPRIVCWTDDNGQRACGNTVPPQYASKERKLFNDRGVVVETRAREATAAERQAAIEAQARAEADAEAAAKREAYDNFLIQTYPDVQALIDQRERRLSDLAGRRVLAEEALNETRKSSSELGERASKLQAAGKTVPDKLQQQINSFAAAEAEHEAALDALDEKQVELSNRYDSDISRFRELTAAQ